MFQEKVKVSAYVIRPIPAPRSAAIEYGLIDLQIHIVVDR